MQMSTSALPPCIRPLLLECTCCVARHAFAFAPPWAGERSALAFSKEMRSVYSRTTLAFTGTGPKICVRLLLYTWGILLH